MKLIWMTWLENSCNSKAINRWSRRILSSGTSTATRRQFKVCTQRRKMTKLIKRSPTSLTITRTKRGSEICSFESLKAFICLGSSAYKSRSTRVVKCSRASTAATRPSPILSIVVCVIRAKRCRNCRKKTKWIDNCLNRSCRLTWSRAINQKWPLAARCPLIKNWASRHDSNWLPEATTKNRNKCWFLRERSGRRYRDRNSRTHPNRICNIMGERGVTLLECRGGRTCRDGCWPMQL